MARLLKCTIHKCIVPVLHLKSGILPQGKVIYHGLGWFDYFFVYEYPTSLSHLQNTVIILTTLWAAVRHNSLVLLKPSEILQRMQSGNKIITSKCVCRGLIFINQSLCKWLVWGFGVCSCVYVWQWKLTTFWYTSVVPETALLLPVFLLL